MILKSSEFNERELDVEYVGSSRSGLDLAGIDENGTRLQISPPRPHFEIWSTKTDGLEFSAGHYFYGSIDLTFDGLKSLESLPLRDVRHDSNMWHSKWIRLLGRKTKEDDVTRPRV